MENKAPILFSKGLGNFKTGDIFEVLPIHYQTMLGQSCKTTEFTEEKKFLIHLVTKQITFNDEEHTILFIKDITFGVLYEQIKATEHLNYMI